MPRCRECNQVANFALDPSGVVQPNCTLPSYIPACQSSWEDWAELQYSTIDGFPQGINVTSCIRSVERNAACTSAEALYDSEASSLYAALLKTSPGCSQATITGSICSGLVSSYITGASVENGGDTKLAEGYQEIITCDLEICSSTFYWPTSTQFAPGCTLGCQSCRITAGTVQLM